MSFVIDFFKYCNNGHLVGAQVSVMAGDCYQLDLAYGNASLEDNRKVMLDTVFRIASISKIVVAMAVLQLAEKDLISLDDDIGEILGFKIRNPRFPNDKITIKMLMTQTSSITDGYDDENPLYDGIIAGYNGVNGKTLPVTLEQLLVPGSGKYYTDLTWSDAAPGCRFIYSNFGCGILACIVEAVTGMYFTDYAAQKILIPLGVDASFRASEIRNKAAIADLYYTAKDGRYRLARTGQSFIKSVYPRFPLKENYRGPAGGLFISMRDLSKIARLLINDGVWGGVRILEKETVDLMLQLHWFGQNNSYKAKGLQLKIMDFAGRTFKGHTGSAYGVISYLFINREEKLGICFITNGGQYRRGKLMYDIQENIFRTFLQHYWPSRKSKHRFTADLRVMHGFLDDRIIVLDSIPQIKSNDIYFSIKNIADIFNIVPIAEANRTILMFRRHQLVTAEPMLGLKAVCMKFKVEYHLMGNQLEIFY